MIPVTVSYEFVARNNCFVVRRIEGSTQIENQVESWFLIFNNVSKQDTWKVRSNRDSINIKSPQHHNHDHLKSDWFAARGEFHKVLILTKLKNLCC